MNRDRILVLIAIILGSTSYAIFANVTGFLFMGILIGSTLITWITARPLSYLIVLSLILELFSTLPVGTIILTALLPFVVHRFRGRIQIDISIRYAALIIFTHAMQIIAVLGIAMFQTQTPLALTQLSLWLPVSIVWVLGSAITWVAAIIISNRLPATTQPSQLSLAGHTLSTTPRS